MTEITKTNIVRRWDKLANADLGDWVSPVAAEIRNFFQKMFESDTTDELYCTDSVIGDSKMAAYARGFKYNMGYGHEDGLTLCFCLDLHSVTMKPEVLEEFDHWLMWQARPHDGATNAWIWYWQALVREEMKPVKKRRTRRAK